MTSALRTLTLLSIFTRLISAESFVNFETALVHPLALSPNGDLLAVCNLPAGRVELFDLTLGRPRLLSSLPTGLNPVTARFANNGELWIANHISDSITIIDSAGRKAIATLNTFDAPSDIIFTHDNRAFISASGTNVVEEWDVATRTRLSVINIDGDRPKAMALSPDGTQLYVAILESGNASTIIAPRLGPFNREEPPYPNSRSDSPQQGLNPAPNSGSDFSPSINPNIPASNAPPRVSVIVRKQNGRWMDDNHGDWTEYISGSQATLTGRVPGWDIADHDVAVISTSNKSVRYVRGLMNICFDLAVNPATGKIAIIGTDAINEVRFEPILKSIFLRTRIAFVDPPNSTSVVNDLNPHLDYKIQTIPLAERRKSLGDPRGIAWNRAGDRGYITGMGSDNIIMIDAAGSRIGPPVKLPAGPTGVLVDDTRNRLYVLSRFDSKLVTLDAQTLAILNTNSLHDPTPLAIIKGRKHLYNTEKSGLGHTACASCHIDARFDRLAWDLGDPGGDFLTFTNRFELAGQVTNTMHPMKGPMVTQTLVDIIGHEPFHWRGDRDSIEEFAVTFMALQGSDAELTDEEMQEFKAFLATLTFPPNPNRNLNNSVPIALALPTERSLGRGALPAGNQLPPGNAARGRNQFASLCAPCHIAPTGLGLYGHFISAELGLQIVPPGRHGEQHLTVTSQPRSSNMPFKIPHLRELAEKSGFNLQGPVSRSGFGFLHDGRVDTLTRFLQDGFGLVKDQDTADIAAFLMAFRGSEPDSGSADIPPAPSRDVTSATGAHTTITNSSLAHPSASLASFINFYAQPPQFPASRVEAVLYGFYNGVARSWLKQGTNYLSDRSGVTNTIEEILALATPTPP